MVQERDREQSSNTKQALPGLDTEMQATYLETASK